MPHSSTLKACLLAGAIIAQASEAGAFTMITSSGGETAGATIQKFNQAGVSQGTFASASVYYGSIPRYGPNGEIYVANWEWYKPISGSTNDVHIARYTASGGLVGTDSSPIFYQTTSVADSFHDMAFQGTRLYVADDTGDNGVRVVETANIGTANPIEIAALPSLGAGNFPRGLAFDPSNPDLLYVHAIVPGGYSRLMRYERIAGVWTVGKNPNNLSADYSLQDWDRSSVNGLQTGTPHDIAFDTSGNLYLLDGQGGGTYPSILSKLSSSLLNSPPATGILPLTNGNATYQLISNLGAGFATGLAIADERVYVGYYRIGQIQSFKLDGSDQQNFATTLAYATMLDVPEPASVALLAVGAAAVFRRRRAS